MQVKLSGPLRALAQQRSDLNIEAASIRELFYVLRREHPQFAGAINDGIAVAINGEIYRDDWRQKIPADAEVVLLPRIQGG